MTPRGRPAYGPTLLSIGQIAAMLNDKIGALCRDLLPRGKRLGHEWTVGSIHGEPGTRMAVHLTGAKAGVWKDFAGGKGGDALDLVAAVQCGGNMAEAVKWSKTWLQLDGVRDPVEIQRRAAEADKAAKRREAAAAREGDKAAALAQRLWLSGAALTVGCVADRYLTGRGIGLAQLVRAPRALRWLPALRHPATGQEAPALLAAVVNIKGQHIGTHRTWLAADGAGKLALPDDVPAKMMLGRYVGGHIPLWKGEHKVPLRALPAGVAVLAAEGIEDGLSAARLQPLARVVALVSVSNFAAVQLPACCTELVIVGQNDPPTDKAGRPHPARTAIAAAIGWHAQGGRTVRHALPPAGIKDFNDWLRQIEGAQRG